LTTALSRFKTLAIEDKQIEAAADRAGLTVGSYVRSRALSNPTTRAARRPPVQTQQLARLLGMLGAVSGAIQQIAKQQNSGTAPTSTELHMAVKDVRDAAAAIIQALGKRPHLSQGAAP
jgi:hypothetical protein